MFGRTKNRPPYGWLSYRQNLLVLYDMLSLSDEKIEALIAKTEYVGVRPSQAQQWTDVNAIELRIFARLDPARLAAEMERKFVAAAKMKLPALDLLRARFRAAEEAGDHAEMTSAAITLLEDMFVKYSYRSAERDKRAEVSRRLTLLGLGIIGIPTFLVFFEPIYQTITHLLFPPEAPLSATGEPVLAFDLFEPLYWASSQFAAFFVVMYFGIVGAYFSRLFRYNRDMQTLRWNEMEVVYSSGALWVRLLVGAIAAAVLFFLMMGDILSGPVFLEGGFDLWWSDEAAQRPLIPLRPSEDFARLIVWCTLAGFSERFVPDRLAEVEGGAEGSGNKNT